MQSEPNAPNESTSTAIFKKPVPTHALKRNTACHQCRRRKLKCDAQRPCSTCLRSHAYAVAHAPPGVEYPSHPECTFDELDTEARPSRSKYERLEGRISELEGLLREMGVSLQPSPDSGNNSSSSAPSVRASPEADNTLNGTHSSSPSSQRISPEVSSDRGSQTNSPHASQRQASVPDMSTMPNEIRDTTFEYLFSPSSRLLESSQSTNGDLQVLPMNWPPGLPTPDVTRHLVHAFFAFHMYAGRLFHGPTFMSSLNLHPSDARFPSPALLHAMCAVGSMYTADIPATPVHTSGIFPYEVFAGRWRRAQARPDSFAEQQAKLAKIAMEDMLDTGTDLIEVLQTIILLSWFYKCQGRWSESYITTGLALRCVVPCGLNTRPPFTPNAPSYGLASMRSASVLAPARSTIEDEMRINIFWIAYALERQQVSGNNYASILDDHDVYQLLPVRGDQFEQGTPVRAEERQWSQDNNVLLVHPKNSTDSFSLFIKSMIVLSQVKRFNVRFKGRFYAGDANMYTPAAMLCESIEDLDPRDTPAFQAVDAIVSSFCTSFPAHLRNPVQDETVDSYLYTACTSAQLAIMLLHEPHATLDSPTCVSATKILNAARSVMDLLYSLASTSFDVSLLDALPYMTWFHAGRVLIRFLRIAMDTNRYEPVMTLQTEIAFVHTILSRAGDRMPVAYRYKKMLSDLLVELCGVELVGSAEGKPSYIDLSHPSLGSPGRMSDFGPELMSNLTLINGCRG